MLAAVRAEPGPGTALEKAIRKGTTEARRHREGQERNIDVGVLIADPRFASHLAGQWLGLVEGGLVEGGLVSG